MSSPPSSCVSLQTKATCRATRTAYQELHHAIWVKVRVGVTGLHLAQRACDHQTTYQPQPVDSASMFLRAPCVLEVFSGRSESSPNFRFPGMGFL